MTHNFFLDDTPTVAKKLLGCELILRNRSEAIPMFSGTIVETEAYLQNDSASHSFKGPGRRNASMYLSAGHIYVYQIYGIHHCVNVVTGVTGVGEAVLIRALIPGNGFEGMWENRYGRQINPEEISWSEEQPPEKIRNLCNGPGKICKAYGINKTDFDGMNLFSGPLSLRRKIDFAEESIETGIRIGLSEGKGENRELRFSLRGSPYLSRR